ncbi:hypothetical protein Tco_0669051 [Tanacetum coccineum]
MTWGWRKVLQLHPLIREFIWYRIGDGLMVSAWFDTWCHVGPLSKIVTTRDIFRAGFDLSTKVNELIVNGTWDWPQEWYSKYPLLCSIPPLIITRSCDKLEWRTSAGLVKSFSVSNVWDCIRPHYKVVPWHDVVWFTNCVPSFSTQVWNQMKGLAGLSNLMGGYKEVVDYLIPLAKRRSCKSVIAKLVFSASVYYIWQERNARIFSNQKRTSTQISEVIKSGVRLKLLSCSFKKSRAGLAFIRLWKLPESIFLV